MFFDQSPPFSDLPPWPVGDERGRIQSPRRCSSGGVCLDRRLVQCKISPRGFESCDVLNTWRRIHTYQNGGPKHGCEPSVCSGWSICLKLCWRTPPPEQDCSRLSRMQEETRGWVPVRPETAVLVMGNNSRLIDASSLFSFSRMRLARLSDECRRQGVELSIFPIQRTP